ncbi:HesB/YadR/YfhF family protein [Staphylococcus debuckii]|uniref:HesB/YadR/YfhF family protein n=1 Tax=Staphylococcus debuckii TaxID=2044912 RepID=A0ABU9F0I8_9STAP|nr:HesB/YadR/YfhF family protein [Staphylococcus debuckii]AYU54017.1 HesB/YadR/YfhF family protein [Staphylococcus debuckii]
MKIEVTDKALKWFRDELDLEPGAKVNFYVQTYVHTGLHEHFTTAFKVEPHDKNASASVTVDRITFYINESDEWFFKGLDLLVDYNAETDEIEYKNTQL